MSSPYERHAQKNRTREAILEGARKLLADGKQVTVAASAAEVGVSKATAYRYFKDPHVLAAEAGLDVEVAPYSEVVTGSTTLREKLIAINTYIFEFALNHEPQMRQFVARSLVASLNSAPASAGRRGARRVMMYRTALEEEGVSPDDPDMEMMIRALATVTGNEAMISLLDIMNLDRDTARDTVRSMTEALLDQYLKGSDSPMF